MASINITYSISMTQKGTVRLQATTSSEDMTPAVFAIEVLPTSADPTNPQYRFSHVCSVSELVEFPDEASKTGDSVYFRTNDIEMVFDTAKIADMVRQGLSKDVQKLVKEYNKLQEAQQETWTETFS